MLKNIIESNCGKITFSFFFLILIVSSSLKDNKKRKIAKTKSRPKTIIGKSAAPLG